MRTPRVLMLLHDYYPREIRVAAEARAALAGGFDVDVIALQGADEAPDEVVEGVHVVRLPVGHRQGAPKGALVAEYLRFVVLSALRAVRLAARARYDVVHVNNPPDFLVVSALLPRLLGAKVVLDFHDLSGDMFMMRFGNRAGGRIDRALQLVERWSARLSDAVVTVHQPYKDELAAHGVPADKVRVVMNSLDERLLPPPAEYPANGTFRVVNHGTITPHYGVPLIVDAVELAQREIPNIRLDVYGTGDALPDVLERVHTQGLDGVVNVAEGFVAQGEVLRLIRGASAGVAANLPTRLNRFALPTKLLEYVVMGIPAVAPALPTITSHFSESEVWFFEPNDARSLADTLIAVARDPAAAAERARAARERYESYRWRHSAAVYTDLLWELAARRRRGLGAQRPAAAAS